jgi:hypothetical protein
MTHEDCQPNLKALRRILVALIAGAVVTFGIALFLILRPPPQPKIRRAMRRCTCQGAGICCLNSKQPVRAGN